MNAVCNKRSKVHYLMQTCILDCGIIFFAETIYNSSYGNMPKGRQLFVYAFSVTERMIGQRYISYVAGTAQAGIDDDHIRLWNINMNNN